MKNELGVKHAKVGVVRPRIIAVAPAPMTLTPGFKRMFLVSV